METVPGRELPREVQGSEGVHTDDSGEQDLVRPPWGWDLAPGQVERQKDGVPAGAGDHA